MCEVLLTRENHLNFRVQGFIGDQSCRRTSSSCLTQLLRFQSFPEQKQMFLNHIVRVSLSGQTGIAQPKASSTKTLLSGTIFKRLEIISQKSANGQAFLQNGQGLSDPVLLNSTFLHTYGAYVPHMQNLFSVFFFFLNPCLTVLLLYLFGKVSGCLMYTTSDFPRDTKERKPGRRIVTAQVTNQGS